MEAISTGFIFVHEVQQDLSLQQDFNNTMIILCCSFKYYKYPIYQWHDHLPVCEVCLSIPCGHLNCQLLPPIKKTTANIWFPFTLMAKLCWTKMLRKGWRGHQTRNSLQSCRKTIALSLLWPFIFRQNCMEQGTSPENPVVFSLRTNNPSNARRQAYTILGDDVWEKPRCEFKQMNNGFLLGKFSSLRNHPSTHARRNRCSRDDVASHGRWKRRTEQVDTYIDVELVTYPGAKVAASLCIDGPCKHYVRSEWTKRCVWWLASAICSSAKHMCGPCIVAPLLTLAHPVLWEVLSQIFRVSYQASCNNGSRWHMHLYMANLPPGMNPVGTLLIVVNGAGEAEP